MHLSDGFVLISGCGWWVWSHVQVDIYSFGMFMYELISLYFPFEKQNLMSSQIEKLVVEGERPPLQNRVSL